MEQLSGCEHCPHDRQQLADRGHDHHFLTRVLPADDLFVESLAGPGSSGSPARRSRRAWASGRSTPRTAWGGRTVAPRRCRPGSPPSCGGHSGDAHRRRAADGILDAWKPAQTHNATTTSLCKRSSIVCSYAVYCIQATLRRTGGVGTRHRIVGIRYGGVETTYDVVGATFDVIGMAHDVIETTYGGFHDGGELEKIGRGLSQLADATSQRGAGDGRHESPGAGGISRL